jgi:pimeloyl-ACP methyl ester carboxylesterase
MAMAAKRLLLPLTILAGVSLATLRMPGAAQQPPGSTRLALTGDARLPAIRELIQQQALTYHTGQLPRPSLYAKLPISEKNAGGSNEPAFNRIHAPANQNAHSDGTTKGSGHTTSSAESNAQQRGAANDTARPDGITKHQAITPGYHPDVRVLAPGRLDWSYVVSDRTLDPEALAATPGYVSIRQSYEFYSPPRGPLQRLPLILSVATGHRSTAWANFQRTCLKHQVLFAGVHGAGNDVPMAWRSRAVLDVLDDVRRRFPVDPDRTYIVGVSGGGHAAASIAHALPELFGGVMAICGAWNLRLEPACRLRVAERLSEAIITGGTDFNRPELEREFFPILRHENVRSELWVYPAMGHGCPGPAQLEQAFQWLEAGLSQRRLVGRVFPASRLIGAPNPAEWSTAALVEAGQRLAIPGGEESGLFLLQGVVNRWPGLPAADSARALLSEFDKASPVPWKDVYNAERLRFRYLQAKTFDGIVNSAPPPNYPVPRANLLNIAVALWQDIKSYAPPNDAVANEAAARLAELHKALGR